MQAAIFGLPVGSGTNPDPPLKGGPGKFENGEVGGPNVVGGICMTGVGVVCVVGVVLQQEKYL